MAQEWPGSGLGVAWEWPGRRAGHAQVGHRRILGILTHFPQIYIKLYVNEVRMHGPGFKICFCVVSLLLKIWAGIGLGPFFPLCDQAISNNVVPSEISLVICLKMCLQ